MSFVVLISVSLTLISRSGMYVMIYRSHVTAVIVIIEASTMIILEGMPEGPFLCFPTLTIRRKVSMAVILWKTRRRLKSTGGNDNLSSIFPLSLFFRSLMFAVYILIGIGFVSAEFLNHDDD